MNRALRALAAVLLALWCSAAAAGGYAVDVSRTSPFALETAPGQSLTASLQVRATGDRALALTEELVLPQGWRALIPPSGLALAPGQLAARLVGWTVPPDAAAGTYTVVYRVRGVDQPAVGDEDRIRVVVRTEGRLALAVIEAPGLLVAGESAAFGVRVTNEGNVPVRVLLAVTGEERLLATVDRASLELGAGASEVVTVEARTGRDEPRRTRRAIRIHAFGAVGAEAPVEAALAVPIDVVPRPSHRTDTRRTLPARVALRATSGDGRVALQPEVAARGALDAREQVDLDLLVRGPDADGAGAYALRDEARLTLATPHGALRLGDQSYGTTPLTSLGRYGRGAGLEVRRGALAAELHHVGHRFDGPRFTETGGWLAAGGERGRIAAAGLRKVHLVGEQDRVDLLGALDAQVRPTERTVAAAEVAVDRGEDGGTGHAWRLASEGTVGRLGYAVTHLRASPRFFGTYTDQDLAAASLRVQPTDTFAAHVAGQRVRSNLALDPGRSAPRELQGDAAAQLLLPRGWGLEAGAAGARRDALLGGPDRFAEQAARGAISRAVPAFGLRVDGRVGGHRGVDGALQLVQQIGAAAEIRPSARVVVGGMGVVVFGEPEASFVFSLDDVVGVSAAWTPAPPLRIEADVQRAVGAVPADRAELRALVTALGGATVEARGQVQRRAGVVGRSALLVVAVPFGAPVGRDRSVGAIRGRLVDADHPEGRGLAGIVVTAGDAVAVTDPDGRFTLRGLVPGEHVLEVDRSTLGLDRVPTVALPMPVAVGAGRVVEADVGFVTGGRIRGRLVLRDEGGGGPVVLGDGSAAGGGVGEVLVTLTDGETSVTRVTDRDGRFAFDGVRPGRWTVAVRGADLPAYTSAPDAVGVEVVRGTTAALELEVARRARPVRMHDGGALELQRD